MTRPQAQANILPLRPAADPNPPSAAPVRAQLAGIRNDGLLVVTVPEAGSFLCECLETASFAGPLSVGDRLIVLRAADGQMGVVLGRVGPYVPGQVATQIAAQAPAPAQHVTIEATQTLTLKCGAASVDLRADGKLMIRGEDVLVRARGTQRIKAGTVSIN